MTERIDDFDEPGPDAPGPGPHAAGAAAGEAARVLTAVQDWANRVFPEAAEQHAGGTCQWCPICQFVAVLRGERPEVTDRVVEAGTALLSAVRAFVDAAVPPAPGQSRPPAGGPSVAEPGEQPGGARAPRVQRIDLGRERRPRPGPHPGAGA